jgi:hypothetical protein
VVISGIFPLNFRIGWFASDVDPAIAADKRYLRLYLANPMFWRLHFGAQKIWLIY